MCLRRAVRSADSAWDGLLCSWPCLCSCLEGNPCAVKVRVLWSLCVQSLCVQTESSVFCFAESSAFLVSRCMLFRWSARVRHFFACWRYPDLKKNTRKHCRKRTHTHTPCTAVQLQGLGAAVRGREEGPAEQGRRRGCYGDRVGHHTGGRGVAWAGGWVSWELVGVASICVCVALFLHVHCCLLMFLDD